MKLNAVLLRAPDVSSSDKYESAFSVLGPQCRAICVPVLETALVNLEKLKEVIRDIKVDGVVMTSVRACEAWKTVIGQLNNEQTEPWSNIPFYVVGAATAASLREIYPNPDQIRGEHTGTAEQLARFILDDIQGNHPKCLLYLTGDKNRDTLPKIVNEGHIDLEALQVYKTDGSTSFPVDLSEALKGLEQDAEFWIVFFAPSAAEFVYPYLQAHFHFRTIDAGDTSNTTLPLAHVAAIGPTTASFLRDTLRLQVDVVPATPRPDALVEAIRAQAERLST